MGRDRRPSPSSNCTKKDGISRANPMGSLRTQTLRGEVAERRDTGTSPPGKYRRIPSKQAVYHFEPSLSMSALGMKSQSHGKLWRHKAETLKAKGRRELKGERAPRVGEKQDMAATRGMNPLLKADFPTRAPMRHGQSLPRCAPRYPSYDTGARPHMSYKLARSAKKVNRRTKSVQPPAVMRPFIFAATSG
jgi:hypothetical protein